MEAIRELLKEAANFVAKTDTFMLPREDYQQEKLFWYTLLCPLFEERHELEEAVKEGNEEHIQEEAGDVIYYIIRMLNRLDRTWYDAPYIDWYHLEETKGSLHPAKVLGLIKKSERDGSYLIIEFQRLVKWGVLTLLGYDTDFLKVGDTHYVLQDSWLPAIREKLIRRFPHRARDEWGLIKDLSVQQEIEHLVPCRFRETFKKQREKGIGKYGQELYIFNGRDAIQDLKEELTDAAVYYSQAFIEGNHEEAELTVKSFNFWIETIKEELGNRDKS